MTEAVDALILGGGFYGLYLAEFLAAHLGRVMLCEREAQLMRRASYANQARVHNGYHYPRSVLTALRSRVNFPRFVSEFHPAIDDTFEKVYAVARRSSKVTAEQFFNSMKRIGAPIQPAPKRITALFDSSYIEAVFLVQECAFNATLLCDLMAERARRAGVDVRVGTTIRAVRTAEKEAIHAEIEGPNGRTSVVASHLFCCGYSQLNALGAASGLLRIPLKHELTEMALVEVPDQLRELGVTVMDGPFFSVMPFPPRQMHTLSHVRYTPHAQWYDGDGDYQPAYDVFDQAAKRTSFAHMVRDAARYVPSAARCVYRDSLWEVKTVLPRSETDDSRPILFKPHFGLRNYHLVMGGKIDNVYDIADEIGQLFGWSRRQEL